MHEAELWVICLQAFVTVLAVLSFLAGLMRLLITVFPVPAAKGPDPAVVAAIAAAARQAHPGSVVVRVEEIN